MMKAATVGMQGGSWFTPGAARNPFPRFQQRSGAHHPSKDLNRLMCAAVVSTRFCRQLLSDPITALAAGYNGEEFQLTPTEMNLVCSIQAASLRSFAEQLVDLMQTSFDGSSGPGEVEEKAAQHAARVNASLSVIQA